MKIRITENRLRQIIAENVRKVLREDNSEDDEEIFKQLKAPGINQAEVARHLMATVWGDMDEDTARSLLSKKVRGVISMTEEEMNAIKDSLRSTFTMS